MKRREHPMIQALVEAYSRRAGVPTYEMWSYLDRKAAPPVELRDAIVATFFPLVPPESFLPSPDENGTLRTMSATDIEPPRRGRPLGQGDLKSKLPAALTKAKVTLAELAKKSGRSAASIRSWSYEKSEPSHRPAPRAVVEMFKDEFGIPLAVWPEIVG